MRATPELVFFLMTGRTLIAPNKRRIRDMFRSIYRLLRAASSQQKRGSGKQQFAQEICPIGESKT